MHKSFLCQESFKDAVWILTNRDTRDTFEHNYSEMSKIVKKAYVNYNNRYTASLDPNEKINKNNVIVRCLDQRGAMIFKGRGLVENVGYGNILPKYTIDCYGYRYQCPMCQRVFDEIKLKDQDRSDKIYCLPCSEYV